MLKNFFRSVRKVAKNIAPIAAPIAGFYMGPLAGAGIGALLGQYGGKEGALRAAMLGGIGGLAGPKGMGLFGGGSTAAPKTVLDAIEIIPVKNVDEVLKVALTKTPKRVEWVEVDQLSSKDKLKKELSTH